MRMLARAHGASYTLCEVMLDQFLVTFRDRDKNKHFLYNTADEQPVAGQLMGAEPEQFARRAQRLAEAGFAVIDINFGCPVKKVLGRCRGGFHLSQPAVALEIIRRTRDAVPAEIPVTVKMRRGIDDSQKSRDNSTTFSKGGLPADLQRPRCMDEPCSSVTTVPAAGVSARGQTSLSRPHPFGQW